jgi:hypothetical protein
MPRWEPAMSSIAVGTVDTAGAPTLILGPLTYCWVFRDGHWMLVPVN